MADKGADFEDHNEKTMYTIQDAYTATIHVLADDLKAVECRFLARNMGISDVTIDDLEKDNPGKTRKFKRELLRVCLAKYKLPNDVDKVAEKILMIERTDLAEKFKDFVKGMKDKGASFDVHEEKATYTIPVNCHGVDSLPQEFVDRPGDIQKLVDMITNCDGKPLGIIDQHAANQTTCPYSYRASPIGIGGGGGIGKTTLALALAQHVNRKLKKEVVWLTVSQQPDILSLFNTMYFYLTGEKGIFQMKEVLKIGSENSQKQKKCF
uniref:Uncharacterized protein LOC102805801 n=1 Tax=Saccoglossus kowalevskii TaxID=10224 RepID=A0ABM0M4D0_SACKO|nr:PREDICTED: uncharacterized protein LOC102805801 [Saccoglossus kowalevskii]